MPNYRQKPKRKSRKTTEICRFCHETLDKNKTFFRPCRCNSFLHQRCLQQWLNSTKLQYCEICQYEYQQQKQYKFVCSKDILLNKMLFIIIFFPIYAILPHIWEFDSTFGFNTCKNLRETDGFINALYIPSILVTVGFTILAPFLLYYLVKITEHNMKAFWEDKFFMGLKLDKIWQPYVIACIPIIYIILSHIIGYFYFKYYVIPNYSFEDLSGTVSFLTFSIGSALMLAAIFSGVTITLLIIAISWVICLLYESMKNDCCIVKMDTIKPYRPDLDL